MKKLVLLTVSMLSLSSFAGLGLSDKVCRSADARYENGDCTIATLCEKRSTTAYREMNPGSITDLTCAKLYDKANVTDPVATEE